MTIAGTTAMTELWSKVKERVALNAQSGRNMLAACVSPEAGGVQQTFVEGLDRSKWYTYHSESTLTRTSDGIRIDHAGGANGGIVIPFVENGALAPGETLTLSFDYRGNHAALGNLYVLCTPTPNSAQGAYGTLDSSGEWAHYERTFEYAANANTPWALLISYYNSAGKWLEIKDGSMMLERGGYATRITALEEMSIGRNLLIDTPALFPKSGSDAAYFTDFTKNTGFAITDIDLESGVEYVFSCDVETDREPFMISVGCGTGGFSKDIASTQQTLVSGHVELAFTPTASQLASGTVFAFRAPRYSTTGAYNYTVSNPKLEKGSYATYWTPAPEDVIPSTDGVEYIVGTQAAATGAWTGVTRDPALYTGKKIAYKLPYAGSGNASLNLTLADGSTTGAKPIYHVYSTSSNSGAVGRVSTHWPAGSIIPMVYDGTRWMVENYNTNSESYVSRYEQYYNVVLFKSAVRAASIIGMSDTGYIEVQGGVMVDLSYPLLWCTGAIAAGATDYSHIYTRSYDRNLATCYDFFTGVANKMVYLVGTLSGKMFTVDSSNFLTCTEPTTEDGKAYIPLGKLGNGSNGKNALNYAVDVVPAIFAYVDGAFRQVASPPKRVAQAMAEEGGIVTQEAEYIPTISVSSGIATFDMVGGVIMTDAERTKLAGIQSGATANPKSATVRHATCATAAATAAKVATLDNSDAFTLAAGAVVAVTFQYGNSAAAPTLNVNGTGAKNVAIPSSATAQTTGSGTSYNSWGAYETLIFTYNGSQWVHLGSGLLQYLAYNKAINAAPKASPALTGTPTAPTPAAGDDTTQVATTAFVQDAVASAKPTWIDVTASFTSADDIADGHDFFNVVSNGLTVVMQGASQGVNADFALPAGYSPRYPSGGVAENVLVPATVANPASATDGPPCVVYYSGRWFFNDSGYAGDYQMTWPCV